MKNAGMHIRYINRLQFYSEYWFLFFNTRGTVLYLGHKLVCGLREPQEELEADEVSDTSKSLAHSNQVKIAKVYKENKQTLCIIFPRLLSTILVIQIFVLAHT